MFSQEAIPKNELLFIFAYLMLQNCRDENESLIYHSVQLSYFINEESEAQRDFIS